MHEVEGFSFLVPHGLDSNGHLVRHSVSFVFFFVKLNIIFFMSLLDSHFERPHTALVINEFDLDSVEVIDREFTRLNAVREEAVYFGRAVRRQS